MFFLLELLSKTDLFLKRGVERGGERGGWGEVEETLGHLSTPTMVVLMYFLSV